MFQDNNDEMSPVSEVNQQDLKNTQLLVQVDLFCNPE